MIVNVPVRRLLRYVHVQFSPSAKSIVTVVVLVPKLPPFASVTEQLTESKPHPAGIEFSSMTYFWKISIPLNTLVFADVPLSTRLKLLSGAGVAVKPKLVAPSG